jgi:hypothetical protein
MLLRVYTLGLLCGLAIVPGHLLLVALHDQMAAHAAGPDP